MNTSSLSKVTHPTITPVILHRWRLISELQHAIKRDQEDEDRQEGYKVILLHTPAGYGKTVLLEDFTRHTSLPSCWYFLDSTDEDPVLFLKRLLESIRQHFSGFDTSLDRLLDNIAETENEQQQALRSFVETLTKQLTAEISERFIFLLCNYQELDPNGNTNVLVNYFVEHLPSKCTLILESRAIPNLNFVFLLAHQTILTLGSEKLRFSTQEIEDLAGLHHIRITHQQADHLEQTFEGWIIGILLSSRLGNPLLPLTIDTNKTTSISLSGQEHLITYFTRYVFARHIEVYQFLRETSVLRYLTPELCNSLLSITDAASLLTYLKEHGLFVTHYKRGKDDIYVCFPILRKMLYNDLESQQPLHLVDLHLKAVELFRGQQGTEAISHALSAKDFNTAADLIESTASRLFVSGEQVLLAQLLDALPHTTINQHPRLLLHRATLFLEESLVAESQEFLKRAIASSSDEQDLLSLKGDILLTQAKLLLQQGNYSYAQGLSRQALALAGIDEIELRATAHQVLGSCAAYLNDFTTSIAEMQQALQLFGRDLQTRPVAKLHTMLANFYGMIGHNSLSEHHRILAIQCWANLNDESGKIDNLLGLGAIKGRQGLNEEAMQLFQQALSHSEGACNYTCGEAYALANIADLYQDQNKFEQALVSYTESLTLSRQLDDVYLVHYINCQLARTYLLMGDAHGAQSILEQLEQEVSLFEASINYEQAIFAFTFGTLLLQTGHIDKAYHCFTNAEFAFKTTKYEYIQVLIYKAASLLDLNDKQAALQIIVDVWKIAKECSYEELVCRELKRCPKLLSYVKDKTPTPWKEPQEKEVKVVKQRAKKSNIVELPHVTSPNVTPQNLPLLAIQALGVPAVFKDEVLLKQWRIAKSMELFFLLLNTPHPLHKERIISYLWPDREELTDQVWRSTLHYLRKAIGAECVYSHSGVYGLQLETTYIVRYDVSIFQELYAQAQIAQYAGDYEAAGQAFEKMLPLYNGDFVASFYGDWCNFRRDELRQACINAHHQLALLAWQQQNLDKSISHWRHMIAMDNMIEAAHEGLIRCYLQQGKRYLAVRHYNNYRSFLQKELGILPSETFQSLIQKVASNSFLDYQP